VPAALFHHHEESCEIGYDSGNVHFHEDDSEDCFCGQTIVKKKDLLIPLSVKLLLETSAEITEFSFYQNLPHFSPSLTGRAPPVA
jgi:hypothetical protein